MLTATKYCLSIYFQDLKKNTVLSIAHYVIEFFPQAFGPSSVLTQDKHFFPPTDYIIDSIAGAAEKRTQKGRQIAIS